VTERLLIGSGNPGKQREYRELLAGLDLELLLPTDLVPVPSEPAETGATFAENASHKARAYAAAGGLRAVADDSGLEVDALRGAPGLPDGRALLFDGEVRGEIGFAPRGEQGFGYDPLFIIAGDGRTMAELPADEKHRISHRGLAVAKLRAFLAEEPR